MVRFCTLFTVVGLGALVARAQAASKWQHSPRPKIRTLQIATNDSTAESTTSGNEPVTDISTVIENIPLQADLATLSAALVSSGFGETLCRDCNYTFFAPTDDAFLAFDQRLLSKLVTPEWSHHASEVLAFHVTQPSVGRVVSGDLVDGMVLNMTNGANVTVALDGTTVRINSPYTNGSQVIQADLIYDNGVLHKVDRVFVPEFAVKDLVSMAQGEFSILAELAEFLNIPPLMEDDDFTVFAPTNAAFLALGNATLDSFRNRDNVQNSTIAILGHAVAGVYPSQYLQPCIMLDNEAGAMLQIVPNASSPTGLMVNDANILRTNVLANNGILHVIDKVLLNPFTFPAPSCESNIGGGGESSSSNSTLAPNSTTSPVAAPTAAVDTDGGSTATVPSSAPVSSSSNSSSNSSSKSCYGFWTTVISLASVVYLSVILA